MNYYIDWRPVGSFAIDAIPLDIIDLSNHISEQSMSFRAKVQAQHEIEWNLFDAIVNNVILIERVDGIFIFYFEVKPDIDLTNHGIGRDFDFAKIGAAMISFCFKCYRGHLHSDHENPCLISNLQNFISDNMHIPVRVLVERQNNNTEFVSFSKTLGGITVSDLNGIVISDRKTALLDIAHNSAYLCSLQVSKDSDSRIGMRAILRLREGFASKYDRTLRFVKEISSDPVMNNDYITFSFLAVSSLFLILVFAENWNPARPVWRPIEMLSILLWQVAIFFFAVLPLLSEITKKIGGYSYFVSFFRIRRVDDKLNTDNFGAGYIYKYYGHKVFDTALIVLSIVIALQGLIETLLELVGIGMPRILRPLAYPTLETASSFVLEKDKWKLAFCVGVPISILYFGYFYCILFPSLHRFFLRIKLWRRCRNYCIFGEIFNRVCIRLIQDAYRKEALIFFAFAFDSIERMAISRIKGEYKNVAITAIASFSLIIYLNIILFSIFK